MEITPQIHDNSLTMETRYTQPPTPNRPASRPSANRKTNQKNQPASTGSAPETPKPQTQSGGAAGQKQVELVLEMPEAQSAAIAGTFNDWNSQQAQMRRDGNAWKITLPLKPGRYEYRFLVDGQWVNDPKANETVENPYGSSNSVLVV